MVIRAPRALAVAAVVAAAAAACATVAGVEVNRTASPDDPPPEGGPRRDQPDSPVADVDEPIPADDAGEGIACGCDSGEVCCVGSPAGCIGREAACNGVRLACRRASNDGRDCCWNDGGTFESTSYGLPCHPGRVACLETEDCLPYGGGVCAASECNGVRIGVCAQEGATGPTCP